MTWVLRHPQKSQGPDRHWGHDISNFGAHYGELTEIIICEYLYCDNIVLRPEGGIFLHLLHLFSDSLSLALLSEKRSFWHLEAASVLTISDIYTYLLWTCFEERKKFPEFFLLQPPTRILGTFLPLLYNLGGQEVRDSPTSLSHRSIFSKYWHCNALFQLFYLCLNIQISENITKYDVGHIQALTRYSGYANTLSGLVHTAYCLVLLDKYRFPREFSSFSAQWVLLFGFALTIVHGKCKCLCHQLGHGYFWITAILVAASTSCVF